MLSSAHDECFICWVLHMLSVSYTECFNWRVFHMLSVLHLVSLMLSVSYAECYIYWVFHRLSISYAVSHWVSLMLSVTITFSMQIVIMPNVAMPGAIRLRVVASSFCTQFFFFFLKKRFRHPFRRWKENLTRESRRGRVELAGPVLQSFLLL